MNLTQLIFQLFGEETNENPHLKPIGGGCIHQAALFQFKGEKYFLKWNKGVSAMFETEAKGLKMLKNSSPIEVPEVIGFGRVDNWDYLCLEYREKGNADRFFGESFGQGLAKLHKNEMDKFGLDHNNYIGSLPQTNHWHTAWTEFFINQRLIPQVRMATEAGLISRSWVDRFEIFYTKLVDLIPEEKPALLHGDLWSGNFLVGANGRPVIFDPAVYYGHREAELAFTKMFGGFDQTFYRAYQEAHALQPGHEARVEIFNLYPLLVHVNLFGSSYLGGVQATLSRFT